MFEYLIDDIAMRLLGVWFLSKHLACVRVDWPLFNLIKSI